MSPEQEQPSRDPYWQHDQVIGSGTFFGQLTPVRLKAHLYTEQYFEPPQINWFGQSQGERTYIFMRPYLVIPSTLPAPRRSPSDASEADLDDLFGLNDSRIIERALGTASATYYPALRGLLVWQFHLMPPFRPVDPAQDPTYQALWAGMEDTLLQLLPHTQFLVTPGWDPQYDQDTWERFLVAVGYLPHLMHERLFMKSREAAQSDPTRQRP